MSKIGEQELARLNVKLLTGERLSTKELETAKDSTKAPGRIGRGQCFACRFSLHFQFAFLIENAVFRLNF